MKQNFAESLPDPSRMVHALSQIGYRLEDAVADLVDNSLTAGASSVLIRFLHDGDKLISLAIADDGSGMTSPALEDAMRFGSKEDKRSEVLSKFGMGLKLASLSHCNAFTVYTRRNRRSAARHWSVENISAGWLLEQIPAVASREVMREEWADLDLERNGTIVFWDRLKGFPQHKRGLRSALSLVERRLRLHLGLTFHRFIERGALSIKIDQQLVGRRTRPFHIEIDPLNPFNYPASGSNCFPMTMETDEIDGIGKLQFDAHIWPPHSEDKEYRLGKRAASHQGFYIYRNDRLIQPGGWNGVVNDDAEPHSSLARVSLDLPGDFDDLFGLNVQKSAVVTPLGFAEAVRVAKSSDGVTWEDYRKYSIQAYRQVNKISLEPVPGRGFPRVYSQMFAAETGSPIKLKTRSHLSESISLDLERRIIFVDSRMKKTGKNGASAKSWDAFAVLLFETFAGAFRRDCLSVAYQRKLSQMNKVFRLLL
jgi:hypothetical protein